MTRDHALVVAQWLTDLLMLTRGASNDAEEVKRKMKAMIIILAKDFPSAAFSSQSLQAIATQFKFMPSYSELSAALTVWWKDSQPKEVVFDDPSLPPEARRCVRTFIGSRQQGFEHLSEQATTLPGRMAISLSFIRKFSPEAFAYICRTDAEAHRIASLRGWVADDSDPKKGWGDPLAVSRSVLKVTALMPDGKPSRFLADHLALLRAAVQKYAPENLGLVPGAVEADAIAGVPARPRAAVLPSERLAAIRETNPIIQRTKAEGGYQP